MAYWPRYRIKDVYSLDGLTGMPQTNYMVERKKSLFSPWTGVQMFITHARAEKEIEDLKGKRV